MKVNLKELQDKNLPCATAKSLPMSFDLKEGTGKEARKSRDAFIKKMNKYLEDFLPPNEKLECINCGEVLVGYFGAFEWGLAHGEGHCKNCSYPARGYHYTKNIDSKRKGRLELILQYHPSVLSLNEEATNEKT